MSETDQLFYADVWGPQEEHHGILLDTLGQRLGLPRTVPNLSVIAPRIRVLGALAHLPVIHEVIRLLYYLTGAATEKSAMMAYQAISDGLGEMGETAIKTTVVDAIKVQQPGHFAFYRLSALEMVQAGALAPWQLHLARFLRSRTFGLVGTSTPEQRGLRRRHRQPRPGGRDRAQRPRHRPGRDPAAVGPRAGARRPGLRPCRLPRRRRAVPRTGHANGLRGLSCPRACRTSTFG